MEPQVRYAKTSDGIGIAYWTYGDGPVLVHGPLIPFSHIEMEWQNPEIRRWYERLARHSTLVRYDGRGNGLSQRGVSDVTLDAHVRDLEAVVGSLGPDPVTVMGVFHSGPAATVFASRHPDRVSSLILWCTYAKGSEYWRAEQAEGLRALRVSDYHLFLRTAAHELLGWSADEEAVRFAEIMAGAVDPEEADRLIAATRTFDVEDELESVTCPALVLHRRHLRWMDVGLSRDLASRVEDGRLVIVDGTSPYPAAGDIESAAHAIDLFLDRDQPGPVASTVTPHAFRTLLFTDLVGHTEMMARLGDVDGRGVLREHERITRDVLATHGGVEVKTLGDGFMASFATVNSAVRAAVDLQRRFAAWNAGRAQTTDAELSVRVGLNAGEPIEEDGDLFGSSVILASRIAALAKGGEILVSNTVRDLSAGKGFVFTDRGTFVPKGFEEELRIWHVEWRPDEE